MGDSNVDSRKVCKYGSKCYQKNPAHHEKFKHPPKKPDKNCVISPPPKRMKIDLPQLNEDGSDEDANKHKVAHDISDSEEEGTDPLLPNIKDDVSNSDEETTDIVNNDDVKDIIDQKDERNIKTKITPLIINYKEFIKQKFLVEMPKDFYLFWDFYETTNKRPDHGFKGVGLSLVGPYDVLADKFNGIEDKTDEEYLLHWRYYYDPPEFQTVIIDGSTNGFHIGYFRDDPKENPVFLASNCARKDGVIEIQGDNIFAAVSLYLDTARRTSTPFKQHQIASLQSILKREAKLHGFDLSKITDGIKHRNQKIVAKTFNKVGLVVPYNKKTQLGYRELALNNKDLATLLTKIKNAKPEQMDSFLSSLQPVFTYASIAADECDFGTGLELGLNLLAFGIDSLNRTTARFLSTSYNLLNREEFAQIAIAHMANRRKGCKLSVLF